MIIKEAWNNKNGCLIKVKIPIASDIINRWIY